MREELLALLAGHGVKTLNVNKDASVHGEPSVAIKVVATTGAEHEFTFAKDRKVTVPEMAGIIKSYLRNRT